MATAQEVLAPFTDVASINDTDKFLIEAVSGTTIVPALVLAPVVRAYIARSLAVTIGDDGQWYIGGTPTGRYAEVAQPVFRAVEGVISYSMDGGTTWTTLVDIPSLVSELVPDPSYDADTKTLTI